MLRANPTGKLEIQARSIEFIADTKSSEVSGNELRGGLAELSVNGIVKVIGRSQEERLLNLGGGVGDAGKRLLMAQRHTSLEEPDLLVGGENKTTIAAVETTGSATAALRVGRVENRERSFGVFAMGGGEQIVLAQGNESVMEIDPALTKFGDRWDSALELGGPDTLKTTVDGGVGDLSLTAGKSIAMRPRDSAFTDGKDLTFSASDTTMLGGIGGAVTLEGGLSKHPHGGVGGELNFTAGSSLSGNCTDPPCNGGAALVQSGVSMAGRGGAVEIRAGRTFGNDTEGGSILLQSGRASNGTSGGIDLRTPTSDGSVA